MIQNHGIPSEEKILCKDNPAAVCRMDRSSSLRVEVRARMWSAWLPIKNPAVAEVRPRRFAGYWNRKGLIPKRLACDLGKNSLGLFCFTQRARQIRLAEFHILVFYFEFRGGI